MIPMYDQQKRHLLKKELKALYKNLTPLTSGATAADGSLVATSPCPYIVSFYDAFTDPAEGTLNFVMEYMDGGSLEVRWFTVVVTGLACCPVVVRLLVCDLCAVALAW